MRARRVVAFAPWLVSGALHAAALHDALAPAGPQAAHLATLWWLMLGVCTVVFAAILAALAMAWLRSSRQREPASPDLEGRSPIVGRSVGAAVAVSAVLLGGLMAASILADRALARLPLGDALHVELTGHQWWWEATYDDADPSRVFSTANELHIPVGRAVVFTLQADDVIHSLWVPSLHGKKDLIPGRTATLELRADRPGVYRGQCAEFCGYEHAKMALLIVADPPEDYARWADRQRQSAPSDLSDQAKRGRDLFVTGSCALCHAVQGTVAAAHHAPDLTHIASRTTLAAGTVPNTAAYRAAWIQDPQGIKPGANMPPRQFSPDDLAAMLAFLDALQ